jgi:hypothetical protein
MSSAHPAVVSDGPPAQREIVAYCRFSREQQRAFGLGLEAQYASIEDYASLNGARIVAEYREAMTGRNDTLKNCPELLRASFARKALRRTTRFRPMGPTLAERIRQGAVI